MSLGVARRRAHADECDRSGQTVISHRCQPRSAHLLPADTSSQQQRIREQLVWPGVHSDIGGGYCPGEQRRSDLLALTALK
ncbi:hypothetical protein GNZ12_16640 [Paraburkholderia sp. 1N]|uniref:DUF2235 domain-containing protein n=1 Tax=Paraburkholderia solitsugae TaxID=2675748 RepID=A0ABX2BPT0_9BURK|nr:hypothetical protein [Paraburkholderia solitsugae]